MRTYISGLIFFLWELHDIDQNNPGRSIVGDDSRQIVYGCAKASGNSKGDSISLQNQISSDHEKWQNACS